MMTKKPILKTVNLVAIFFFLCLGALFLYLTPRAALGPDAHGYFIPAKNLAVNGRLDDQHFINQFFSKPVCFYDGVKTFTEEGKIFTSYNPGLSFLMATVIKVTGNVSAAFLVVPLFSLLMLMIFYLLASHFLPGWLALVATLLFTFQNQNLQYYTGVVNESTGVFFILLGSLFALTRESRLAWLLSGLAFGAAVLVRYTNVLAILPVFIYFFFIWRTKKIEFSRILFLMSGLAPFALFILLYNAQIFGSPFATGYSAKFGWYDLPAFSWKYAFFKNALGHGQSFFGVLKNLFQSFYVIHLAAFLGIYSFRKNPHFVFFGSQILLFVLFYSFYAFEPLRADSRFLMAIYPWIGISGLVMISKWLTNYTWQKWVWVVLSLLILASVPASIHRVLERNQKEWVQHRSEVLKRTSGLRKTDVVASTEYNDGVLELTSNETVNIMHFSQYYKLASSSSEREKLLVRFKEVLATLEQHGYTIVFFKNPDDVSELIWSLLQTVPYQLENLGGEAYRVVRSVK